MVRSLCLASLFVVSLIAWAQASYAAQLRVDGPDEYYKLEGTVVNAQTGQPIPHALVQLYATGTQAVLTGAEGEFSFDKLPMGATVQVRVEKPGFFVPGARPQTFPTRAVQIGPRMSKLILKLVPECVITGEVMNDQGEPVEGATVDVLMARVDDGRRELTDVRGSVTTDENGLFRIAGLQAARYFVSVKASTVARPVLGAQTSGAKRTYPLVSYFPGGTDIASATPFDLVSGQRAHAQFTLSLAPAFKLSGTISGMADFKQAGPPMIVDATQTPLATVSNWSSQTGAFEFSPIPSGVYTLRVSAMIDDRHPAWTTQSVTLDHNVSGFNFPLHHAVTIPISVQTEFSDSQKQCTGYFAIGKMRYGCKEFPAMVTLSSLEANYFERQAEAENADPSTFALHAVMPGRYHVHATATGHGYVYSVRSGGTDLLREELIVPSGGDVQPIEIILRDDDAKVKIHVQAEHIPEGTRILLLPEFAPFQRPITLDVSANGDREYGGLAPGNYKVLAFESIDTVEYENPEVLEKYSGKTARITLSSHGTTDVSVELIRDGE
ncbi:MAG TPA: carboxypeptidase-like regulatory domain-containing protein [Candidatus Angelobacter sp.]|nr:carboxypeptidase-like regulatory domain-containing protein [Candidatus Angelobacter sp.]